MRYAWAIVEHSACLDRHSEKEVAGVEGLDGAGPEGAHGGGPVFGVAEIKHIPRGPFQGQLKAAVLVQRAGREVKVQRAGALGVVVVEHLQAHHADLGDGRPGHSVQTQAEKAAAQAGLVQRQGGAVQHRHIHEHRGDGGEHGGGDPAAGDPGQHRQKGADHHREQRGGKLERMDEKTVLRGDRLLGAENMGQRGILGMTAAGAAGQGSRVTA